MFVVVCCVQEKTTNDLNLVKSGSLRIDSQLRTLPKEWIDRILKFSDAVHLNEVEAVKLFWVATEQVRGLLSILYAV